MIPTLFFGLLIFLLLVLNILGKMDARRNKISLLQWMITIRHSWLFWILVIICGILYWIALENHGSF
ncbi:MAG: hypothetical protein LPK80_01960 [Bacteroidota bacterium]|nr:hypothetical protein [Bacteroidota bacterium]MDX5428460.1 hypothetical protein [Bacteroidota bacterium]